MKSKTFFHQKILLLLLGLFLFFILLETSLRLSAFALRFIQKYGNTLSLRQKDAYRIMCIGESVTVHKLKDCYPLQLNEILNRANIGIKFSVINCGAGGKNSTYLLEMLEANLDKYKPDMVIAMMGINDGGIYTPYENKGTSKTKNFISSLRVYRLARLLRLHIASKIKEKIADKTKNFVGTTRLSSTFLRIRQQKNHDKSNYSIDNEELLKMNAEAEPVDENAYLRLEQSFKETIALSPMNVGAYNGLGRHYREYKKYAEAEEVFKKIIELTPSDENAYMQLGMFYKERGELDQAEKLLKKVAEINPGNKCVYAELGWLYIDEGRYNNIEEILNKAIKANTELDSVYGELALLYQAMGKQELAREYYNKTNELRLKYYNPVTVQNYLKLKDILDERGIKLVCVQYPVRSIDPLKKIFNDRTNIVFVDNEKTFKDKLNNTNYKEHFEDMFAGDFGHCTKKGNKLLAKNIASVILKEVFGR